MIPAPLASHTIAKPLGGKAYGSIGHLPSSRLGPGDWSIHEGQARIACEKPRRGDHVIVTEKLDGACMAVANIDGQLVPLTRAGYPAAQGTFEHLREFVPYVELCRSRFEKLLRPGERIVGEWLALAHGTRYEPGARNFAPFVAFDLFRNSARVLHNEFWGRVAECDIEFAAVLHASPGSFSVADAEIALGDHGYHGAIDRAEGCVWRVEREGRVDFLAKYVRQGKQDGRYLPNISGNAPIWHWRAPLVGAAA